MVRIIKRFKKKILTFLEFGICYFCVNMNVREPLLPIDCDIK